MRNINAFNYLGNGSPLHRIASNPLRGDQSPRAGVRGVPLPQRSLGEVMHGAREPGTVCKQQAGFDTDARAHEV